MKWMAVALLMVANLSHADEGWISVPSHSKWKEECGSCHLAYPPQFLSAESWQKLMNNLDNHFGDNAAIDPKDRRDILEFLRANAGRAGRNSSPTQRISDTPWFRRVHDEVPSQTWFDPAVKSRANCAACHVNAEQGNWSEHGVRLPGGLRWEGDEDDDDD